MSSLESYRHIFGWMRRLGSNYSMSANDFSNIFAVVILTIFEFLYAMTAVYASNDFRLIFRAFEVSALSGERAKCFVVLFIHTV